MDINKFLEKEKLSGQYNTIPPNATSMNSNAEIRVHHHF